MEKIKIILVDDHQIVRDGIKSIINNEKDMEVVAEASNYSELCSALENCNPDIILMDISLPDKSGIEITRILAESAPELSVLMLSMHINDEFIMNSINAGASGYIPKNTTKRELLNAIRTVFSEGMYFTPHVSNLILKNVVKTARQDTGKSASKENSLSGREIEILKLFAEGFSNQEIADKLFISSRTVESHKNHIMQKLDLKSPVEMVRFAIKNKIVEI
jgi:DNA-binding NarL/FixJ family response regulator